MQHTIFSMLHTHNLLYNVIQGDNFHFTAVIVVVVIVVVIVVVVVVVLCHLKLE